MSAKRPTALRLGNHDYTVRWGYIEHDDYHYGRTIARQTVIEIDPNNSASQIRDTLLHEVIHAIINDVPARLSHEDEEHVVRCLTPGLLAALRDNPHLVRFLRDGANSG